MVKSNGLTILEQIEFKALVAKDLYKTNNKDYYLKTVDLYREIYINISKNKKTNNKDWKKDLKKKYYDLKISTKNRVEESVYNTIYMILSNNLNGFSYIEIPTINFEKASIQEVLESNKFIVFDFETTGLDSKWNDITQIGAVKIEFNKEKKKFEITDKFNSYVQPRIDKKTDKPKKIPKKIVKLTKITDEMVKDAPNIFNILPKFVEFIDVDSILVAHNFNFDKRFLEDKVNFLNNYDFKLRLKNKILDTLTLSREVLPDLKNKKLETVAKHFNIDVKGHHKADKDSEITAKVLINLLKLMKNKK